MNLYKIFITTLFILSTNTMCLTEESAIRFQNELRAALKTKNYETLEGLFDTFGQENLLNKFLKDFYPAKAIIRSDDPVAITALIDRVGANAQINDELFYGTLLIYAAERNKLKAIKTLLDAGARPNRKDDSGETALHNAVREGNFEAAQLLLQYGADATIRSRLGEQTAMDIAINNNDQKMIDLLQRPVKWAPIEEAKWHKRQSKKQTRRLEQMDIN